VVRRIGSGSAGSGSVRVSKGWIGRGAVRCGKDYGAEKRQTQSGVARSGETRYGELGRVCRDLDWWGVSGRRSGEAGFGRA
jgi:hypothetical protein